MKWYNNDGATAFPEVLVQSGSPGQPVDLEDAFSVAVNVYGESQDWSEVAFSNAVGSESGEGLYVIFRVPDSTAAVADGAGGGPAIGYALAASGYRGWLSPDGEDWAPLHSNFGFAVQPVLSESSEGAFLKLNGAEGGSELVFGENPTAVSYTTTLQPASPNPFNPQTTLRYSVKEPGRVSLQVYDVRGALVSSLVSGVKEPGEYTVTWTGRDRNGANLSSGVYFARFSAGDVVMTQRLVMVR